MATDAGLGLEDEDRLPWLEPAEGFEDDAEVSPARLLIMVLGGLLLIGAVLGGLWWVQNGGARGQGELIVADKGDYKVPPKTDGAKTFEGEGRCKGRSGADRGGGQGQAQARGDVGQDRRYDGRADRGRWRRDRAGPARCVQQRGGGEQGVGQFEQALCLSVRIEPVRFAGEDRERHRLPSARGDGNGG